MNTKKSTFDLYDAVNANWEKNYVLPPTESEWGTFRQISSDTEKRLKAILKDDSSGVLHQLYNSIMNLSTVTDRMEAQSILGIIELLNPDNYRDNRATLGYTIGLFDILFANPLFSIHVAQDPRNTADIRLTMIYQNNTLPDKIYYEDPSYADYVDAYKEHAQEVTSIFSKLTDSTISFLSSDDVGRDVVEFETLIAKSCRSSEEKRNMDSYYMRLPYSSFIECVSLCDVQNEFDCQQAKNFWNLYFKSAFIENIPNLKHYYSNVEQKTPQELVIYDPPYFQKLTKILMTQPIEKICRYLAYHVLTALLTITVRSFDDTYTRFVSIKLNGQTGPSQREDRVLRTMNNITGELLGNEYVKRYFNQQSKDIVLNMTNKIKHQMKISLESNDWMSDKTKQSALRKLEKMNVKIGYPDKYEDREYMAKGIEKRIFKLKNKSRSVTSILIYIRQCHFAHDILSKIDTPKDPSVWGMNPQDVNAYYSPQMNEIVFPAGILNSPVFDPDQDIAINYGCIGTVIAHEITHGFDDQGSRYDYQGNIDNWWTPNDLASFKNKIRKIIDQYADYKVNIDTDNGITQMKVNGYLTLGENIADLGGVVLSLGALEEEIRTSGREMTNEDRRKFFESYALLWRKKISSSQVMSQILSDPHAPARYRVWIVRNIDSFYDTYNIKPGDLMYLDSHDRVKLYSV